MGHLRHNRFLILLALVEKNRHGYGVMKEIERLTHGETKIWPANLYGALKDLQEEGLVAESHDRPDPDVDDERRRYYRLTELGREAVAAEVDRLEDLVGFARTKMVDRHLETA
jgi:DNA-binding PadR family transcriptional regulator